MPLTGEQMTTKCRYQADPTGVWYLSVYGAAGSGRLGTAHKHGPTTDSHPDWLKPILVTAAAADAFIRPDTPPPGCVLWFTIDRNYNLLGFGHE